MLTGLYRVGAEACVFRGKAIIKLYIYIYIIIIIIVLVIPTTYALVFDVGSELRVETCGWTLAECCHDIEAELPRRRVFCTYRL